MRCAVCGRDELLPFTCAYCGERFCAEHRLPEKHNCLGLQAAKSPEEIKRMERERRGEYTWDYFEAPQLSRVGRAAPRHVFGREEPIHLLAGAALVALVGFSLNPGLLRTPQLLLIMLLGFAASFIIHEIAHKIMAQNKGLFAEFRIFPLGAVITAITALLPIKVIAPGAVNIMGATTRRELGVIALVGPLTNIILAVVLAPVSMITNLYILRTLADLNAFIAFFNLIPFPPLDGHKILTWNTTTWIITFIAALALMIII